LDNVERGTVIYAEYIKGIVDELETALSAAGWRVGQYTGEQKAGLAQFQAGEIDVLIGSRAVGTGVDGLQHCANTLIIASAP
jgi:reverse gyrase